MSLILSIDTFANKGFRTLWKLEYIRLILMFATKIKKRI